MALWLCAWRLFRALGCGGVGEVDYRSSFLMWGAVASALLRQSRDMAEALSEVFLVGSCALSEGRAHSLEILQYSLHCHPKVYITPHENCYHSTKDCYTIRGHKIKEIPLYKAKKKGRRPCDICY